ncbi:hypothetical protein TRIP_B250346 [uncultured Desulfatiglans sp.]|nr:hypothetical protein TRIP_B250346 [uncultured Desulfatiglans sp.]
MRRPFGRRLESLARTNDENGVQAYGGEDGFIYLR